jgi:hypothetical protein
MTLIKVTGGNYQEIMKLQAGKVIQAIWMPRKTLTPAERVSLN